MRAITANGSIVRTILNKAAWLFHNGAIFQIFVRKCKFFKIELRERNIESDVIFANTSGLQAKMKDWKLMEKLYSLAMPSLSISSYSVGRLIPSSVAALVIFPECFRSAR